MSTSGVSGEAKLQQCITECCKLICAEIKKYCAIVKQGSNSVSLIIAHEDNFKNAVNIPVSDIQDTELFRVEPDAISKLKFSIERAIHSEEETLKDILIKLQDSYSNIMVQLDKIWNAFKISELSMDELFKASETSLSVAEILDEVDSFRRSFSNSHDVRKYSHESLLFSKDKNQILKCWDTSSILSLKEELSLFFSVE